MDPDQCLLEVIELAKKIQNSKRVDPNDTVELAEKVLDLDYWIRNEGFIPREWRRPNSK
jgi:hypothetical protein